MEAFFLVMVYWFFVEPRLKKIEEKLGIKEEE